MTHIIFIVMLILLLIMSVFHDSTASKIPNKITIPAIMFGLVLSTVLFGLEGLQKSLFGFLLGFLVLLIPFILGGMGAGDVKLMAAIGSLMGAQFVVMTFIYSSIIGGVISIIYGIYKRGISKSLKLFFSYLQMLLIKFLYLLSKNNKFLDKLIILRKVVSNETRLYIPYAIPIALGACIVIASFEFKFPAK